MEYFWLARRIVEQMFRFTSEQLQEEIVAEAICEAWCSNEPLTYGLMRVCVRGAGYKHLSFRFRSSPILLPLHMETTETTPEPALPHKAQVFNLGDYRQMPRINEKLAFQ